MKKELTYPEALRFLGLSKSQLLREMKRYGIKPIRRGHRTVRIPLAKAERLHVKLFMEGRGGRHGRGGAR